MTPEEYEEYYRNLYAPKTLPEAEPTPIPFTTTPSPSPSPAPSPCPAPEPDPFEDFDDFYNSLRAAVVSSRSSYNDDELALSLAVGKYSSDSPVLAAFQAWISEQISSLGNDEAYYDFILSINDYVENMHWLYD